MQVKLIYSILVFASKEIKPPYYGLYILPCYFPREILHTKSLFLFDFKAGAFLLF